MTAFEGPGAGTSGRVGLGTWVGERVDAECEGLMEEGGRGATGGQSNGDGVRVRATWFRGRGVEIRGFGCADSRAAVDSTGKTATSWSPTIEGGAGVLG